MDLNAKKTALRMIENGVFILTTRDSEECYSSTVTFVTQTSFDPPLIIVALRLDSGVYQAVRNCRRFALHMLGRNQKSFAAAFFKHSKSDESTINGKSYSMSELGNPILDETIAHVECDVVDIIEQGDHHIVAGEVVEAAVRSEEPALSLSDTGWSYGG